MFCSVVIVAAGNGSRMGTDINKPYLKINGKEVLAHAIEKFQACHDIDEIIIVTSKDEIEYCAVHIREKYGFSKVKTIVAGGEERQNSVYNGLLEVNPKAGVVLIHDGARPLIKLEQIKESIEAAKEYGACVVAVPVKDTIKVSDKDQFVMETPSRDTLWSVQTPQGFKYDWIMKAYEEGFEKNLIATDDSMMVEFLGYKVKIVEGRYDNIKITTPEDLIFAEKMI